MLLYQIVGPVQQLIFMDMRNSDINFTSYNIIYAIGKVGLLYGME